MIRYSITLLLIGCAHGVNDPMPTDEQSTESTPMFQYNAKYQPEHILICDVKKAEPVEDCTLYSLVCDDNSNQLILLCSTQPVGVITNPPLPI